MKKSKSLPLVRGCNKEIIFFIGEERIPTIKEKLVKSLGSWYSLPLTDHHGCKIVEAELVSGLHPIDKSSFPDHHKVCSQFALLPHIL